MCVRARLAKLPQCFVWMWHLGPLVAPGEVSSAQGNPQGDGSRAQLEELKELNADWGEGFDQRAI